MKKACENCSWWTNSGYKDHKNTEHLGFCDRFKQVTARHESDCIGFNPSTEKEDYFRNLEKAKQLNIELKNQLTLDL